MRTRLYISSIVILVIGLCCSIVIYLTAGDDAASATSYVVADGVTYAIPASTSKMHVRELQRFGGKAAVLFDEIGSWFARLWQGKSLAYTVAWISVFASLGVYLFARYLLLEDPESEA